MWLTAYEVLSLIKIGRAFSSMKFCFISGMLARFLRVPAAAAWAAGVPD